MNLTVKRSSGVACSVPRKFTVWVLNQLLPMKPSPRASLANSEYSKLPTFLPAVR